MKQEVLSVIFCITLCVGSVSTFFASEIYSKHIKKNAHKKIEVIRACGVLVCIVSLFVIYVFCK